MRTGAAPEIVPPALPDVTPEPVAPHAAPALPGLREEEERICARLREIAVQRQRLGAADALLAREWKKINAMRIPPDHSGGAGLKLQGRRRPPAVDEGAGGRPGAASRE